MATKKTLSDAATLELYRVALENAESQPEIAAIMDQLGYDSATIAQGKALLAETRAAFDLNKTEDDESSAAYALFTSKRENLEKIYGNHRKLAKVVFRNNPVIASQLAIDSPLSRAYLPWIEAARKFYSTAAADPSIQAQLSRLKITPDQLTAPITLIAELETARTNYLREKGESQEATKAKDAAFAQIDKWMSDFYAVARIGLEDKPQLLESLGKFVRS